MPVLKENFYLKMGKAL